MKKSFYVGTLLTTLAAFVVLEGIPNEMPGPGVKIVNLFKTVVSS